MKYKTTLLFSFFVSIIGSIYGQIASENFNDSKLPNGWATITNTGPCAWNSFTNDPPSGPNFGSIALIFNDDSCGNNDSPSNVSLISAAYNVQNISPLLLSVDVGLQTITEEETLTIEVFDGSAWILIKVFNGEWNPYTFKTDVSTYANSAFKVRFTYDDNGQWSYYAGIDNFLLTQEALPDSPSQTSCAEAEKITTGTYTAKNIQRGNAPIACAPDDVAYGGAWFTYTPRQDGITTVTSALSENGAIDTRLSILTGSCGALTCYAQNDDSGGGFYSTSSFEVTAGTTYFIVFDDKHENSGFKFTLSESEEPCVAGSSIAVDFSDLSEFNACHTTIDGDGDGNSWSADAADFKRTGQITYFALNGGNDEFKKDDYLFSPKLTLTAGTAYKIAFTYNGGDSPFYPANENLQVLMSDAPEESGSMTLIYEKNGIKQQGSDAASYDMATHIVDQEFIPETTGDYFLTFKTTSADPSGFLLLFDYSVDLNLGINTAAAEVKLNHFYNKQSQKLELKSEDLIKNIQIYSDLGQQLLTERVDQIETNVDLSGLSKGIYIATVSTATGTSSFKILKR